MGAVKLQQNKGIETLQANEKSQISDISPITELKKAEVKKTEAKTKEDTKKNPQSEEKNTKEELTQFSEKTILKAVEEANKRMRSQNKEFEYSIHEKTKQVMIKIRNAETKEIIKEIPNEKIVDMIASMCETAGLFVDEKG